jgi:hypothetical protein
MSGFPLQVIGWVRNRVKEKAFVGVEVFIMVNIKGLRVDERKGGRT